MQKVQLSKEKCALVDDDDLPLVMPFRWAAATMGREQLITYATTMIDRRTVYMHRLILGVRGRSIEVDHRDGNGLNNVRSNLRRATHSQNLANQRPQQGRSSKFKGVSFYRSRNCWEAYIKVDGQNLRLGYFKDEVAAAMAYDDAARSAWGEFAHTNFPQVVAS